MIEQMAAGFLALTVALATSGSGSAPQPPAAPPAVSDGCRAAMGPGWGGAFDAYKAKDWAGALSRTESAKAACAGDARLAGLIATFRAENLMRLARPAEAVAELDAAPPLAMDHPLWLNNRLLLLAALAATKDDARFIAVRDELIRVNEANLTGGGKPAMVKVERIDTEAGPVDVFRNADKRNPPDTLFILTPKAAVMPISFEVNEGEMAGLAGLLGKDGPPRDADQFGDLNECAMHATLMVKRKVASSYPDLRKQALDALTGSGKSQAVSGSSVGTTTVDICPGLSAILPALPRGAAGDDADD